MVQRNLRRQFLRDVALAVAGTVGGGLFPWSLLAREPIGRRGNARLKLSCAAYSYRQFLTGAASPTMTLDDFIDACAAMNLDGCELTSYYFPKEITARYLNHLKQKTFLLGLDVSGTAVGNNFCLPLGAERDRQIADVKRWVDYAVAFGAPCIRIFAGDAPKGHTEAEARSWAVACMEECCAYAGQGGVFLALENHGGPTTTAEGLLAIVKEVQSPWFGVNLDTGNFFSADPYADMAAAVPYAVNVQVKTEIRPGGGAKQPAELARVVDIVQQSGYRGYLALEYEAAEDPRTAVPRYCALLQKLIS